MDLKRKDVESCGSSVHYDKNQKKKKLKADDDSSLGFGGGMTLASSLLLSSPSTAAAAAAASTTTTSSSSSSSSTATSSPPYWTHFRKYKKQFTLLRPSSSSPRVNTEETNQAFTCPKFDNKEYERSYLALKSREIKLVYENYTDGLYSLNTGSLVLKQRYLIVDWMVDVSMVRYETTFLAVTLLDRVLARGFFKRERLLQLLGVACLMLASKIEENMEENEMVEQDTFYVGDNSFSMSEIIGMETLVLKVLDFNCYVPTIYNFLGFYLKAVNADAVLEMAATNLGLISLLDNERLCYSPSIVAAALVILASRTSIDRHMLTITEDVQQCVKSLGEWIQDYQNQVQVPSD